MEKQQVWLLRIEGLAILIAAVLVYADQSLGWWWFVLGILLPDISMLGYLANNKLGAYLYNLGHSLILPLLIAWAGYSLEHSWLLAVGLVWTAHIGMDRTFGYGLKSVKGFHHTHLGKIGQK